MKELSNREKVLILILLIVALCFGYYRFFLSHVMNNMSEKKNSIQTLQVQEQKIKAASADKEKLNSELKEVTVLYNASLLEIPKQYRNSEIAYQLKALCDANSTVLSSVTFGNGSPISGNAADSSGNEGTNTQTSNKGVNSIYSVPVTLNVTGNYNAVMNLVDAIEKGSRTSQVESIGITSSSAGEGLSANISLTFYYINNGGDEEETYNFNTGSYGKPDLFN